MAIKSELNWFINKFGSRILSKVKDTPLSVAMLSGIAMQETGYIWKSIRNSTNSEKDFLALCVGDTLGASAGRRAFPINKAELLTVKNGDKMFKIARDALEGIAAVNSGYRKAATNSKKFCRGYGIFQLDLQFFKNDPEYFLSEGWSDFEACLDKAFEELMRATKKLKLHTKTVLTSLQEAHIAIAYNRGRFDPAKGLHQGHKNKDGQYYGELVFDYIKTAHKISKQLDLQHEPNMALQFNSQSNGEANAYVGTEGLRLRETPNGKEIRSLTIAEPVTDLGSSETSGWRRVKIADEVGVVYGKYLRQPSSSEIEALINRTVYEWVRFEKGKADEKDDPHYKYVGEMWKSINEKYTHDGRSYYTNDNGQKTSEVPWSAAFISHVVKNSGDAYSEFLFAPSHSQFVNDAIGARTISQTNKPFWGYRRTEVRPEVGDIIQINRGKFKNGKKRNFSFDYAENHAQYPSHSDIVVEVTESVVRVIGGNVGDTVALSDSIKEYKLNSSGKLRKSQRIICILKNRAAAVT